MPSVRTLKHELGEAFREVQRTSREFEAAKVTYKRTQKDSDLRAQTGCHAAHARAVKNLRRAERLLADAETVPLEALVAARPNGSTKPEEVYRPDSPHGFLADLRKATYGDRDARERLTRNESIVTGERRDVTFAAGGQGFQAPSWFSEAWVSGLRAPAALKTYATKIPMPERGFTGEIPKVDLDETPSSGGAGIGPPTTETAGQAEDADAQDTDLTSEVLSASLVTIAGAQTLTAQIADRMSPGAETAIIGDLLRSYESEFDRQMIVGGGDSHHEFVGLFDPSVATTQLIFNNATPTPADFLSELSKAAYKFADARGVYPSHLLISPRRVAWLMSSLQSEIPVFAPGGAAPAPAGAPWDLGQLLGMRIIADGNVPTTYGAGTNAEIGMALLLPEDLYYTESAQYWTFKQALSAKLVYRFEVASFAYYWPTRRPQSIATVQGTAFAPPSGY